MDRDTKFSESFRKLLQQDDVEAIRLPPRSPNENAHMKRFMRTTKDECLSKMIFLARQLCDGLRLRFSVLFFEFVGCLVSESLMNFI